MHRSERKKETSAMRTTWKRQAGTAVLAGLIFALIGCAAPGVDPTPPVPTPTPIGAAQRVCVPPDPAVPISFQLNFAPGGFNAGFALALQRGYYEEVGLRVNIVPGHGSGTTARLVASGQAGLAYADAATVMQIIAQGAEMKLLATMYQSSPNAINALVDSGIESIADLRGKRLAEPTGEAGTAMLPLLLEANGLTLDDITRVAMPGAGMVAALAEGHVDAIIGSTEGWNLVLEDQGFEVVVLPYADWGVPTVSTSIFASKDFLERYPNEVRCFIEASLRGWDEAIRDPDAAIEALVATFPHDVRPELNRRQLDSAIKLFCANNARFVGKAEPAAWERTVQIAQEFLGLPTDLPATAYYTYDFLPETLPTACPIE
jgi:NitT/TauT family transport system substrate-binding protein